MSRISELVTAFLVIEDSFVKEQSKEDNVIFQEEYDMARRCLIKMIDLELERIKAKKITVDTKYLGESRLTTEEWNYYFKELDINFINSNEV